MRRRRDVLQGRGRVYLYTGRACGVCLHTRSGLCATMPPHSASASRVPASRLRGECTTMPPDSGRDRSLYTSTHGGASLPPHAKGVGVVLPARRAAGGLLRRLDGSPSRRRVCAGAEHARRLAASLLRRNREEGRGARREGTRPPRAIGARAESASTQSKSDTIAATNWRRVKKREGQSLALAPASCGPM